MILEDEFKTMSDELIVVTDDGSYDKKALVTERIIGLNYKIRSKAINHSYLAEYLKSAGCM